MPKKINRIGYENEYIKVLKLSDDDIQIQRNNNKKRKLVYWECLCKRCQKKFHVASENIYKVKSCGCSRRYQNANNEIGKKYGKLTILSVDRNRTDVEYKKGHQYGIYYRCKCECGSEKTYNYRSLKYGHTKSCGCFKFNNPLMIEDLTGHKFFRLNVLCRDIKRDKIENQQNRKSGNVHWLCKCECGNKKLLSVTGWQLKSGHTKSCGCIKSEMLAERNKIYSVKTNEIFKCDEDIRGFVENGIIRVYNEESSFVVDFDDYLFIRQWFWRKGKDGYWLTNAKQSDKSLYNKTTLRLHQLIAERKYGKYDTTILSPDHLSRDKSDNRKCNIMLKTNSENMRNRSKSKANTSGKTGVSFVANRRLWVAYITVNYQRIHLGYYSRFGDAVKARLFAEYKYGFFCDDEVADYDNRNA